MTCTELGLVVTTADSDVCVTSYGPDPAATVDSACLGGGVGLSDVPWTMAAGYCSTMGMRQCTKVELEAGVGSGAGCGRDGLMVWTSAANGCLAGEWWAVQGNTDGGEPTPSSVCRYYSDPGTYAQCCGDTGLKCVLPAPTETPTASPTSSPTYQT